MSCEIHEEQVSAYLDRELTDSEAEVLFKHLGGCVSCRNVMNKMLELRSGLREEAPLLAPKELDERVLSRARRHVVEWQYKPAIPVTIWRRRLSLQFPVAAVAATVLIFLSVVVSSLWLELKRQSDNPKVQTVFLTTVPPVEVRAYEMEPVVTTQ